MWDCSNVGAIRYLLNVDDLKQGAAADLLLPSYNYFFSNS